MKLKKLISRINEFADADQNEKRKDNHRLKKTLRKLKEKYVSLCESLNIETDQLKREAIENKIKIVQTQRKKGIALRKELKEISEDNASDDASEKKPE